VGGGTEAADELLTYDGGPSPRGRGNPDATSRGGDCAGAIPAWAGEPSNSAMAGPSSRGHPRVGGGTNDQRPAGIKREGPSPRGRGNPLRRGLSRYAKYCSARGVTPVGADQAVYESFFLDVQAHCLVRCPRETQQTAGRTWNKASGVVPGWPDRILTIPDGRMNPSLPWTAFPDSFLADVEAYRAPPASSTFKGRSKRPVFRKATIAHKKAQIRQLASALAQTGHDRQSIRRLADIVEPVAAETALQVIYQRGGEKVTCRLHGLAYLLVAIARHWVKADAATIEELQKIRADLAPEAVEMTRKNKLRLMQFNDPRLLAALLDLPGKLFDAACRTTAPTKATARLAQLAVAIAILSAAPIRIKNLAQLEVGRTLILGASGIAHILIDRTEVKNNVDLEIPLPKETGHMIEIYLKRFHPLLAPPACMMLWPSADGGHKRETVLSTQIFNCLRSQCGIDINVHLFRHLAAKLYLDAHPGDYGVVRLLLGHKSLETTMKAYCGAEQSAAFKLLDEVVSGYRTGQMRDRGVMSARKVGR
jgi:integrase